MNQQIIAVGGGGFSTESEPGIDQYILDQALKKSPKIGFIATASGDAASYLMKFHTRFSKLDCVPSHLDLFRRTSNISGWMSEQDIIFVGGGNTKSMLGVWSAWDLQTHLRIALEQGTVLAGISAGAICWFEAGVTDSWAGELKALEGLGFLSGSCCPHYSLEADRAPVYRKMIRDREIMDGFAIDDGACVHFEAGRPKRVVSARGAASAYYVSVVDNELKEVAVAGVEMVHVT
ncbi:MAG: dipeptidase E [Patiriisocius sp.]|jgi:dipeptidase E